MGNLTALQDQTLLRTQCLVGGRWIDAQSGESLAVVNPASQLELARVPRLSPTEVKSAIDAAETAFQSWRLVPAQKRAHVLRSWFDLLLQHEQDLARLVVLEQGKPYKEALAEVRYAASYFEFYAEEAKRIYGEVLNAPFPQAKVLIEKQPVGVVGIITPWNFPIAMMARKVAPALAAGCTCVVKPDEKTPLSAFALMELGCRAGVPPGVVNTVTGIPLEIGTAFTASKAVRKISFTGSTAVGKWLLRESAHTVKRVTMELGGNAPFIVFEDAELDAAVDGLILAKFRNAGQTCVCANRIFVQRSVLQEFTTRLQKAVQSLNVGEGFSGCDVGPLIDQKALDKTAFLVQEALNQGATLCCGGEPHALGGLFYSPTVLTDVRPGMALFSEEQFAPIAAIVAFDTDQEVIALANDTTAGLASYFYTQSMSRVWQVAEALDFGMVAVNSGVVSSAAVPFGGVKESGMGREGARQGLEDYLTTKYIHWSK